MANLLLGLPNKNTNKEALRPHRGPPGGDWAMRRRKPDLLLVLAVIIGFGVVATSYALDLGEQPSTTIQSKL